jgi:hypothetical protein
MDLCVRCCGGGCVRGFGGIFDQQIPNQWKDLPGYCSFITSAHLHYHHKISWVPAFFLIINRFVFCLRLFQRQASASLFNRPDLTSPGFPTYRIVSRSWSLVCGLMLYLILHLYHYVSDFGIRISDSLPASVPVLDIWY